MKIKNTGFNVPVEQLDEGTLECTVTQNSGRPIKSCFNLAALLLNDRKQETPAVVRTLIAAIGQVELSVRTEGQLLPSEKSDTVSESIRQKKKKKVNSPSLHKKNYKTKDSLELVIMGEKLSRSLY